MNLFCRSLLSLMVLTCTSSLVSAQDATTGTGSGTTTATPSNTGVLVYELKFEHLAGFNIDFWDGGWVVLPGTGGTGSVVLTGKSNFGNKIYRQFDSTVYSFQAKRHKGKSTVIQMTGGTVGTKAPLVAIQAFGDVTGTISLENPTFTLRVDAAKTLRGLAQASLDESLLDGAKTTTTGTGTSATTTTTPSQRPTDGTMGYIEFAETKLNLDTGKTEKANKKGRSVADTVTNDVINDLKARGYTDGTSTGTTTGGGTGSGGTGSGGTGNGTN